MPQDPERGGQGLAEPLLAAAAPPMDSEGEESFIEEAPPALAHHHDHKSTWQQATTALLSLQLGWGLWLFPSDYARLGWCAHGVLAVLAVLTAYSGTLFARLYNAIPGVVLFADVGQKAAGSLGRNVVYVVLYSLDATRCVILHLAAAQSLRHMMPPGPWRPSLWECGAVVFVGASMLVQIRSLAELSWVFMTGTGAQLIAVGIVMWELISNPDPNAHTEWVAGGGVEGKGVDYVAASVSLMNMIFAFGGQFAFTEIMGSMRKPTHFPRAVMVCTVIMGSLYCMLGSLGYWSRGDAIQGIVIFSLPESPRARVAAGCILIQATAQYLINLNVWTHNLLVLLARLTAPSHSRQGHAHAHGPDHGDCGHGHDHDGHPHDHDHDHDHNGHSHDHDHEEHHHHHARCASDHCWWRWLVTSVIVVAYSYAISVTLPFFSTLVGLVTAATYLIVAYALPAWFTLKLLGRQISAAEKVLLAAVIIPASLFLSGVGLWGSIVTLQQDMSGGEGGWGTLGAMHAWGARLLSAMGL